MGQGHGDVLGEKTQKNMMYGTFTPHRNGMSF